MSLPKQAPDHSCVCVLYELVEGPESCHLFSVHIFVFLDGVKHLQENRRHDKETKYVYARNITKKNAS